VSYIIDHTYLPVMPEHPRPLSAPDAATCNPGAPVVFDECSNELTWQAWCDLACATYMPKSPGHLNDDGGIPNKPAMMWSACEYPERSVEQGRTVFSSDCDKCYIAILAYCLCEHNEETVWQAGEAMNVWDRKKALSSFEDARTAAGLWVWRDGRRMVPA
jgi:hypothetical protein